MTTTTDNSRPRRKPRTLGDLRRDPRVRDVYQETHSGERLTFVEFTCGWRDAETGLRSRMAESVREACEFVHYAVRATPTGETP